MLSKELELQSYIGLLMTPKRPQLDDAMGEGFEEKEAGCSHSCTVQKIEGSGEWPW